MRRLHIHCRTSFLFLFLAWSMLAKAELASVNSPISLVNERLFLLDDENSSLSPEQAFALFKRQEFSNNIKNKVSFGFTQSTIWAVLPFNNDTAQWQSKVLKIDNAWLDTIELYIFTNNKLMRQISIGDTQPFTQRQRNARMPSVEHAFPRGQSYVLFRFRSQDPMTIPIYIGSDKAMVSAVIENAYFYGALYGGLLILLIYNLALYIYLRELKYLLYPIYLFAFTSFNFTYTGHGFWLAWPGSVALQQWLMPTLMFCYIFSAVMFTIGFLNTRTFLPALHANRYRIYVGLIVIAALIFVSGDRSFIIMIQLAMLTVLSIWMLLVGCLAYKNKDPLAKFFIPAITMGTGGATISSFATWGIIPYSQWAFRGIEIGMLLEMSLLSISLGFNFKLAQDARKSAESNARQDPLTMLYNRRAFSELVHPSWELSKRNNSPISIMLMDLDWFKRINDQFGHAAGDQVLEGVAKEIKRRIRDSDIPLRWGGEEFLIFLPNTNSQQAKQLAEDLRTQIKHISFNKINSVTMSIGVVSATPDQMDLDQLITLADEALYTAKENGRNTVVVVNNKSTLAAN
ncbi:diguanylate cyclase (GGDEF) domain-containing protein [Colwellia chukchiensis]|uniref:diguanylate cyclase n=1 Tax=Colwellia chukchiensis TaxID=641665 RepID=A0A1H7GV05_9GAMM|nr:diguanylate cyclase [Colwellia chukchiensis]SEK41864.1 diguanylate cyclase (GGDEF) domain-containing protein [Colwellia chukchiensis]